MPPKPTNWAMYGKMAGIFLSISIGGPAFVYWVSPTEEELFLKYNPELQKRSLESRFGKEQNFDNFVGKLKEYSKSDKNIWDVAAEAQKKSKDGTIAEQAKLMKEMQDQKDEIRKSGTKLMPGGSL